MSDNDVYLILKKPIITEKGTLQKEKFNKVTFEVNPKANKINVKQAVEKLFKVKVLSVHMLNVAGKKKRLGKNVGRKSDWKKAIVTLREGERIDFFEGM
jgi:large subunit ribosomal protein L23